MKTTFLRSALLSFGLMACITPAHSETVTLATNGVPAKTIAIPTTASSALVATGSNLRVYLNRITTGTFSIVTYNPVSGPPADSIVLCKSAEVADFLTALPTDDPEKTENFIVAAANSGDNIVIAGASDLAVSHGVYELLQQFGCRWFFPGDDWEIIPTDDDLAWTTGTVLDTATVDIGTETFALNVYFNEEPDYKSRYLSYVFTNSGGGNNSKEWLDNYNDSAKWNTINRNIEAVKVNNTHSYAVIVKWAASQTTDPGTVPPTTKWKNSYFALVDSGTAVGLGEVRGTPWETNPHTTATNSYQLCVANPEVVQLVRDYADWYFTNNPTQTSISLEPNDGATKWCNCVHYDDNPSGTAAGCRDLKWAGAYDSSGTGNDRDFLSDRVLTLANAVAADHPDKTIGILAYGAHSGAPHIQPLPNVNVQVVTGYLTKGMTMPILLQQWATAYSGTTSAEPNMGVYDYYSLYSADFALPLSARATDLKFMKTNYPTWHSGPAKADSYKAESSYSMGMGGLGQYITMKLLWNVDANVDALRHDFLTKCFAPDSDPLYETMNQFYLRIDRGNGYKLSPDLMGRLYGYLDDAYTQTSDPAVLKRIDALALWLKYCDLRREWAALPRPNDLLPTDTPTSTDTTRRNNLQSKAEEIMTFVWQIRKTNMVDSICVWKYPTALDQNASNAKRDYFDWPVNTVVWPNYAGQSWAIGTKDLDANIPGPLATTGTGGVMERQPWKVSSTFSSADAQDFVEDGIANNPLLAEEPRSYDHDLVYPGFAAKTRAHAYTPTHLKKQGFYVRTSSAGLLPAMWAKTGYSQNKGEIEATLYADDAISILQTGTIYREIDGHFSGSSELQPLVFAGELAPGPNVNCIIDANDFAAGTKYNWTASSKVSILARSDWPFNVAGGAPHYFYVPKGTKNVLMYAYSMGTCTIRLDSSTGAIVATRPTITQVGTDITIPVPNGGDGRCWYINSFLGDSIFFHNIPGVVAASPNELLLPREAFAELVPSGGTSAPSRGSVLDFEDTTALHLYGTGTTLPVLTITPNQNISADHVWTLYDEDGTTVLDSGTLSAQGVATPVTFSTTFTNTRTCLFVYDDLDVGGLSNQIEWTAGKKVTESANSKYPGNGMLVDRRYFYVPKRAVSFSYSADSMNGGTFYTAAGVAKHTQANTGGAPTGVVTVAVGPGEDNQIWYLGNVSSSTNTASAKNLIFADIPGHLARRPDELLVPQWTFFD